jgi:hypothetical protein
MREWGVAHLQLELILDADPIAGRLQTGEQESRPFSGWIELTRAIELGLDEARRARPAHSSLPPAPAADGDSVTQGSQS